MSYPGLSFKAIAFENDVDLGGMNSSGSVKIGRVAHVFIWGPIGGWWGVYGAEVFGQLAGQKVDEIRVYISSGGGGVKEAFEIYNLLKSHPATVTTVIFSLAASAATIVSLAGDTKIMMEPSMYMIHEGRSMLYGSYTEDELELELRSSVAWGNQLVSVYKNETPNDEDTIRAMMKRTEWMTPDVALSLGFIDKVEPVPIPFHLAQVTEESFQESFAEHTAEYARSAYMDMGFVASAIHSIKPSNKMKFFASIASFIAGLGVSLQKDGKDIKPEEFHDLFSNEKKEEFQNLLNPHAEAQAQKLVQNAIAEFQAENESALQKEMDDLKKIQAQMTNQIAELKAGKSGGTPPSDKGIDIKKPDIKDPDPDVSQEIAFGQNSNLHNSVVASGGLDMAEMRKIRDRVKAERAKKEEN